MTAWNHQNPEPCTPERDRAISMLAAGDLSGEEAERLRDHMENCEPCRRAHRVRSEMAAHLEQDIQSPGPSEKRREQAMHRMMAEHRKKEEKTKNKPYLSTLTKWTAAAVLLLVLIFAVPMVSGQFNNPFIATAVEGVRLEVQSAEGDITIRDRSGIEHPGVSSGTTMGRGARIWTGTRSKLQMQSDRGETITLQSVSHLRVGRRNERGQLELYLVEGSLTAKSRSELSDSGGLLVLTEGGRIEAPEENNEFDVTVR